MDNEELAIGNFSNFTELESFQRSIGLTIHDTICTLFCLAAICANVLIVHTIFRFQRLRTVPNIFVANWVIATLAYLIIISFYYAQSVLENGVFYDILHACVLFNLEKSLYLNIILFTAIISVDWCMAVYFPRASEIFRKYYKFTIGGSWIFSLIFFCVVVALCLKGYGIDIAMPFIFFPYYATLFFIVAVQCYRILQKIKQRHQAYPTVHLTLMFVFVLARIPHVITYTSVLISGVIYLPVVIVLDYLTPLHCILNLILLYLLDNDFQACLRQVLKRSGNKYEDASTSRGFEHVNGNREEEQGSVCLSFSNTNKHISTVLQ